MRPIKFRAWNIKTKTMFYTSWESGCYIDFHGNLVTSIMEDCIDEIPKDMYDLMIFTGLQDKNGKEIYFGDIFKRPWDYDEIYVLDDLFTFGYNLLEFWMDTDCIEIIGNIHENGDLLCKN